MEAFFLKEYLICLTLENNQNDSNENGGVTGLTSGYRIGSGLPPGKLCRNSYSLFPTEDIYIPRFFLQQAAH